MRFRYVPASMVVFLLVTAAQAEKDLPQRAFDSSRDLISLHYDHAADKDDGHSAAADRTLLESQFDQDWMPAHVLAVSGAYGKNAKTFNTKSDAVMRAVWDDRGGWLSAHNDWDGTVDALVEKWGKTLQSGGDIWVKEGGQSDLTADVVRRLKKELPRLDTNARIHVVQHSNWNEKQTTAEDLEYTKKQTDYIRIEDANRYLNVRGGDSKFVEAAEAHPSFGPAWKAAFKYYNPKQRLDFSDTGELLHILGLGEIGIDPFREKYLDEQEK